MNNTNNNTNTSNDEFYKKVEQLKHMLIKYKASIVDFTNDFSFGEAISQMSFMMIEEISAAINNEEFETHKELISYIYRYINQLVENLDYKLIPKDSEELVKTINLFIINWLNMIEEGKMLSEYSADEKTVNNIRQSILEINDIIDELFTITNLIKMTGRLITRAESVIAATPAAFKISEHFMNIVNDFNNKRSE